jgi:phosphoribosyl-ATP pyrophosphohydrolase/phosphoribosyl-AMP cyclohydrolase
MIKLDEKGLVSAIVQDDATGQVLMLGYMNPESLKRTLEGENVWFYSRSRSELWLKGETSGNFLKVKSLHLDCDGDAILVKADPIGPTCHTGNTSCFFTPLTEMQEVKSHDKGPSITDELFSVIQSRKDEMPEGSYTTTLFEKGADHIAQKVIEEAGETAIAGVKGDGDALASEAADMIYHTLVLLAARGVTPEDVWAKLRERRK